MRCNQCDSLFTQLSSSSTLIHIHILMVHISEWFHLVEFCRSFFFSVLLISPFATISTLFLVFCFPLHIVASPSDVYSLCICIRFATHLTQMVPNNDGFDIVTIISPQKIYNYNPSYSCIYNSNCFTLLFFRLFDCGNDVFSGCCLYLYDAYSHTNTRSLTYYIAQYLLYYHFDFWWVILPDDHSISLNNTF